MTWNFVSHLRFARSVYLENLLTEVKRAQRGKKEEEGDVDLQKDIEDLEELGRKWEAILLKFRKS